MQRPLALGVTLYFSLLVHYATILLVLLAFGGQSGSDNRARRGWDHHDKRVVQIIDKLPLVSLCIKRREMDFGTIELAARLSR